MNRLLAAASKIAAANGSTGAAQEAKTPAEVNGDILSPAFRHVILVDNKHTGNVLLGKEFDMLAAGQEAEKPSKPADIESSTGLDLGRIVWHESPRTQFAATPVSKAVPTILFPVNESTSPLQFFLKLLPSHIFELSTQQTNLYARQHSANWTETTVAEQKAFFAAKLFMRLAPLPALELYWSDKFCSSFVRDSFPQYRFRQLSRYWHFNDNASPAAKTDPYHRVRPLIEAIKTASQSVYSPGAKLSVDESMFAFSGPSDVSVFMGAKPHPWGHKVWMVADAVTFFACDFNLYAPRKDGPEVGLTQKVVLDLVSKYERTGRTVFMDNFYTSVMLFVRLYRLGILAAGTVGSNRKGVPPMIRKQKAKQITQSDSKITEHKVTTNEGKTSEPVTTERKVAVNKCKTNKRVGTVTANECKRSKCPATESKVKANQGKKSKPVTTEHKVTVNECKTNKRPATERKASTNEGKTSKPATTKRKMTASEYKTSKHASTTGNLPANEGKRSKRPAAEGKQTASESKKSKPLTTKRKRATVPKRKQGDYSTVFSGILTCSSWQDNKGVNLLSTIPDGHKDSTVCRWQRGGAKKTVPCPTVVNEYNASMLGVDKHNQLREQYQARVRSKKWWVSVADDLISTATTNAYILYHNFGSNQLEHFEFLYDLAQNLAGGFSAWRH
jgi:hypothetical protein